MNIFKSTRFAWWQLGILKWAVLFIGIAVGATWPEIFAPYAFKLLIVGVLASLYLGFVWLNSK